MKPSMSLKGGKTIPYHSMIGSIRFNNVGFFYPTRAGQVSARCGLSSRACSMSKRASSCVLSVMCYTQGVLTVLHFGGSWQEWCISSMIYSRDIPFGSGTLDLFQPVLPFLCFIPPPPYLSLSLSPSLFLSVFLCLSVCLSLFFICSVSVFLCFCLSVSCLAVLCMCAHWTH